MDTKSDKKYWMDMVKEKCNMKGGLVVPSIGKSRGLALYWKDGITVVVQSYSQTYTDALVEGGGQTWGGGTSPVSMGTQTQLAI